MLCWIYWQAAYFHVSSYTAAHGNALSIKSSRNLKSPHFNNLIFYLQVKTASKFWLPSEMYCHSMCAAWWHMGHNYHQQIYHWLGPRAIRGQTRQHCASNPFLNLPCCNLAPTHFTGVGQISRANGNPFPFINPIPESRSLNTIPIELLYTSYLCKYSEVISDILKTNKQA